MIRHSFLRVGALAVVALVGAAACGNAEKNEATDAGAATAESRKPTIGGKLGAAVAAAEASAAQGPKPGGPRGGPAGAGGADGPPESGVFPPGRADKESPKNAAPKIQMFSDGNDPKATLTIALADEQKIGMVLTVKPNPQQALPNIVLDLVAKAEKKGDKDDGKKDDGKKDKKDKDKKEAKDAEPEPDGTRVIVKITGASLDKDQAGSAPKDLSEAISKLKGSAIRFVITPDGRTAAYQDALAKDAPRELGISLRALYETIADGIAPFPDKPVGAGAYWMVSDRSSALGIDVVRYRVFKVEKVDGAKATVSIETREYSASGEAELGGQGKLFVQKFDAQGKANVTVGVGLPVVNDLDQKIQASVGQQADKPAGMFFFQFSAKGR